MLRRSLLSVLGLTLTITACASSSSGPPPSAKSPMLNQSIQMVLPLDSGGTESVPAGDGSATVIDFWAPSCEPCSKSLPALVARAGDIEKKGGKLLLVAVLSSEETDAQAAEKLRSWGVDANFMVDRDGLSKSQAGVSDLPATLVLDRTGKLVWVAPEGASPSEIIAAIPAQ